MRFTPLFQQPLSRRAAVAGLPLALATGAALGSSAIAATPRREGFDPDSPEDNLRTWLKLQYSVVKEPIYSYFGGHVFLLEGDLPARLLFEVTGFGQGWVEPQPDGSYHLAWKELGFLRDPVTGRILDHWKNPLTGEEVEVSHISNPAANSIFKPRLDKGDLNNFATADVDMPGGNYRHPQDPTAFILPWTTIGDTTSVWQDTRIAMKHTLDPKIWKRESSGERISIGEFVQLVARTDELFDPRRNHVPYTGAWARIASWHPWMKMGQRPGKLFYRCTIQRLRAPAELPGTFLRDIETRAPDYLVQPIAFGPRYSTWKNYLATHKPDPSSPPPMP